ncbi:hypothetical protein UFOVP181_295 [uncultured Caudovirales phage]|uniref:Uncharacterized protein n=1 Tax=uncultured Caudovirales phage TaxID=2100421 RepID=A0A6J5KYF3_9CAUD|nr:hypothetical protein UFOVP57_344 [uncultured Caudovirales phage]CAB5209042.1 hypothetical protein UFOVP181_295 [uncultured Caudovirales phage]
MKTEKPAEGIMKRNDFGDSKSYNVGCQCCGSDCEHNIWVEADITGISVTTYTQQKTNWWSKTRWQHMWTLLTKGYIELEASIIMSQQQALNYADTLRSAIKDVETFRKEKNVKN